MFTKAVKYESSLKMSLSGPPGSGKTWTSLTLATTLADGRGVALIDTEHGSASLYADHFSFDTLELDSYHPQWVNLHLACVRTDRSARAC